MLVSHERIARASEFFYQHENDSQRRIEEHEQEIEKIAGYEGALAVPAKELIGLVEEDLAMVRDEHALNLTHSNVFAAGARDVLHEIALEEAREAVVSAYERGQYDI